MLVNNVINNIQNQFIGPGIFNLYMRVSSMPVISVTFELLDRIVWQNMLRENIKLMLKIQNYNDA